VKLNSLITVAARHTQALWQFMPAREWLSAHRTLVCIIRVSQGSVATHLRCGGIFNDNFIANCLHRLPVKQL